MTSLHRLASWFDCRRRACAPGPCVPGTAPSVLELRIHGVNNTAPDRLLDVAPEDAEKVRGDTLGSFWTLTEEALTYARAVPETHHDHVPPDVHREAYTWGAMARNSPAAPFGIAASVVSVLSRAGWMLLLPFGFANVAYWSRTIPAPQAHGRGARSVRVFGLGLTLLFVTTAATVGLDLIGTQCFRDSGAAGSVTCSALPGWLTWLVDFGWAQRLVILSLVPVLALLVLLWLASAARVRWETPVASAVPEPPAARPGGATPPPDDASVPVLARRGLWSRWALGHSMSALHLAAGLALVVAMLAWTQVYAQHPTCHSPRTFFTPVCLPVGDAYGAEQPFVLLLAASALVLTVAVALVAQARAEDVPGPDPRAARARGAQGAGAGGWAAGAVPAPAMDVPVSSTTRSGSTATLAAALLLFGGNSVLTWFGGQSDAWSGGVVPRFGMLGLVATPGVLLLVLLGIALAGLGWRRGPLSWLWITLALGFVVALGLSAVDARPPDGPGTERGPATDPLIIGLVLFVALVLVSWVPGRAGPAALPGREVAWRGCGPGVFLLLSLGSAMLLSGLAVVAVGDWLNGTSRASCLDFLTSADASGVCSACTGLSGFSLTIPAAFGEYALAMLVALSTVLAIAGGTCAAAFGRAWWSGPDPAIPAASGAPSSPRGRAAHAARVTRAAPSSPTSAPAPGLEASAVRPPGTSVAGLADRPDLDALVRQTRRQAALLQRGEFAVAVVAVGLAVAVACTLFLSTRQIGPGWPVPHGLVDLGLLFMGLLWVGFVARVVLAGEAAGRPIALLWDLMCFLPRSAHPFAPPCYAERAVPEIAARMDAWLRADDLDPAAEGRRERAASTRRVVLSAESLGAVLAIAAIFTWDTAGSRGRPGRVALLSHGTQVRAYFGRFFPELLGPAVLGTAGCGPAQVLRTDPWRLEVADPPADPLPGRSAGTITVVRKLGGAPGRDPAWASLWRRTDPLGLPVASYAPNAIDRGAEEIDVTAYLATVAAHGGYSRTGAYRRALRELIGRLG